MGRNIRICLDLIKPKADSDAHSNKDKNEMKKQFDRKHGTKSRAFDSQKNYVSVHTSNNKFQWKSGTMIEHVGKVMYNILLENNRLIRARTNQLRNHYNASNTLTSSVSPFKQKVTLAEAFEIYDRDSVTPTTNQRETGTIDSPNLTETTDPQTTEEQPPLRRSERNRRPPQRFVPC